ncbi:MAG: UDP-N-acetylglucosamine 2-epimerase (hydrolyzing) [Deltaproteobacteria bacterium]|nr:UDP-N-acetylglucosamine 2-epimerase (hydrolyzing) [Deltaproteobacteria bacterium]
MNKKILFITGTRADFGKLKPLITKVDTSKDFECYIFVTGMHTLSRYGYTMNEVYKTFKEHKLVKGFSRIHTFINQVDGEPMDTVLANTIKGFSRYIHEFRPDLIVVHGDRVETLAGAIVGSLNNIPVAHIEGGEISGTVDELIRHAVTKFAQLHFVANTEAERRLVQIGEVPESIFVIGSPEVDVMLSNDLPSIEKTKERYNINFDDYAIFCYHPVTTEVEGLERRIDGIIDAVMACGWNFVLIHPNNDHGSDIIMNSIETKLSTNVKFRIFPSLRFEYFLTLLKNAKAIVGNSSAGVREAPVYGVPTVNIGSRQHNRFNYKSIVNTPDNGEEVLRALNDVSSEKEEPTVHFGKGNSAEKFIETLRTSELWERPVQKQFQDLPQIIYDKKD